MVTYDALAAPPPMGYEDPARVVEALAPVPGVIAHLRYMPVDGDPTAFGERVRRELIAMDVAGPQSDKLLAAAAEIFDNAQSHGPVGLIGQPGLEAFTLMGTAIPPEMIPSCGTS